MEERDSVGCQLVFARFFSRAFCRNFSHSRPKHLFEFIIFAHALQRLQLIPSYPPPVSQHIAAQHPHSLTPFPPKVLLVGHIINQQFIG